MISLQAQRFPVTEWFRYISFYIGLFLKILVSPDNLLLNLIKVNLILLLFSLNSHQLDIENDSS